MSTAIACAGVLSRARATSQDSESVRGKSFGSLSGHAVSSGGLSHPGIYRRSFCVSPTLCGLYLPEYVRRRGRADTMARLARNSGRLALPADVGLTPGTFDLEIALAER